MKTNLALDSVAQLVRAPSCDHKVTASPRFPVWSPVVWVGACDLQSGCIGLLRGQGAANQCFSNIYVSLSPFLSL